MEILKDHPSKVEEESDDSEDNDDSEESDDSEDNDDSEESDDSVHSSSESRSSSQIILIALRAQVAFKYARASSTIPSNSAFGSSRANLACLRVALPQVESLKPVSRVDFFLPADILKVRGRVIVSPLVIAIVNVPVTTRVSALST
jgi:hypothetical protein